jgi:hypothetical protein
MQSCAQKNGCEVNEIGTENSYLDGCTGIAQRYSVVLRAGCSGDSSLGRG